MKLEEFIANFEDIVMVDHGTINMETQLSDLEDWDSLSKASLLATFEEQFSLKLEDSALRNLQSFAEIVELIKDRLE
ncbi:acyl carrier protein [Paenibacillus sp. NPDC058071]|uniref:acyl carrier protein n=1 Tax=Paenibacillus sp. NPDC058071 TaxID=3346326 RepID=UPI0036DC91BB